MGSSDEADGVSPSLRSWSRGLWFFGRREDGGMSSNPSHTECWT